MIIVRFEFDSICAFALKGIIKSRRWTAHIVYFGWNRHLCLASVVEVQDRGWGQGAAVPAWDVHGLQTPLLALQTTFSTTRCSSSFANFELSHDKNKKKLYTLKN